VVEKLLAAANASSFWYERMPGKMALKPWELAYDYMTRSGRMTDEQRNRAELSFWMNMLAYASEPGARAGGAVGKAGMKMTAEMNEVEKENKRAAMEVMKSNKEDLYRLAQMADKEGDNERADQQFRVMEENYRRTNEVAADRVRVEREKLKSDKYTHIAKEGMPLMRFNKTNGTIENVLDPVSRKPIMIPKADRAPTESEQLYSMAKSAGLTPREIIDRRLPPKQDPAEVATNAAFGRAMELQKPSDMGGPTMSPEEAADRVRRTGEAIKGKSAPPLQAKPMPKNRAELRKDEIYQTARGPAKWNGTAFEAVRREQ